MNSNSVFPLQSPRVRIAQLKSGLLCVGLIAIVGCGNSVDGPLRASVNGTVTLDGKPLEAGTIRFVPLAETGGPKTSASIVNGRFDLPGDVGPVVGQHRVEIETPPAGKIAMDDEQTLERLKQAGSKAKIEVVRIPSVYNKSSRLTARISDSGLNDLSFDLVSKTRR